MDGNVSMPLQISPLFLTPNPFLDPIVFTGNIDIPLYLRMKVELTRRWYRRIDKICPCNQKLGHDSGKGDKIVC